MASTIHTSTIFTAAAATAALRRGAARSGQKTVTKCTPPRVSRCQSTSYGVFSHSSYKYYIKLYYYILAARTFLSDNTGKTDSRLTPPYPNKWAVPRRCLVRIARFFCCTFLLTAFSYFTYYKRSVLYAEVS